MNLLRGRLHFDITEPDFQLVQEVLPSGLDVSILAHR